MKTYKALAKALKALKDFRAQSENGELSDGELARIAIVKHTDWAGLSRTIDDLESTIRSHSVQKHSK